MEKRCHHGVIAQLVERVLSMHEALGSTPSNSIFLICFLAYLLNKSTVFDHVHVNVVQK